MCVYIHTYVYKMKQEHGVAKISRGRIENLLSRMILVHGIQQTPGIFYPRKIRGKRRGKGNPCIDEKKREKRERVSGRISGEGRTKVLYIYIYIEEIR